MHCKPHADRLRQNSTHKVVEKQLMHGFYSAERGLNRLVEKIEGSKTTVAFPTPDSPVTLFHLSRDHSPYVRVRVCHLASRISPNHFGIVHDVDSQESELICMPFAKGPPPHGALVLPGLDENTVCGAIAIALVLHLRDDPREKGDADIPAHESLI